jgi:hypothetical protein
VICCIGYNTRTGGLGWSRIIGFLVTISWRIKLSSCTSVISVGLDQRCSAI